jgi:hypothetical protein
VHPLHEIKVGGEPLRIVEVGRVVAELPVDLCE